MPTKTKEINEENIKKTATKKTSKAKVATKKTAATKKSTAKTKTAKTTTAIKATKTTSKKETTTTKKTTATKKVASKKSTSTKKASTVKKVTRKAVKPIAEVVEYYDLPYRYNETIVKILYQSPDTLFVYWDISDSDRENYIKQYGENFFNITRPVLIVHNDTMNYSFEIPINDFANSWYLHINDASCDYVVELGRRFITSHTVNTNDYNAQNSYNDYVYVTSSNTIETPNNQILFDKLGKSVFFRNIKTNFVEEKYISSLSYIQNIGKIYNIYELYKQLYNDEITSNELDVNNPSSYSNSNK